MTRKNPFALTPFLVWPATALAFVLAGLFTYMRITRPHVPGIEVSGTPVMESGMTNAIRGVEDLIFTFVFTMFAPIGSVIAARLPRHPIAWICIGVGLLTAFASFSFEYAVYAFHVIPGLPLAGLAAWVATLIWAPPIGLFGLLMLLFPNGKPPSRRWRWVAWTTAASLAGLLVAGLSLFSRRGPEMLLHSLDDGSIGQRIAEVLISVMFAMVLVSLASLIYRFHRSIGAERQQLKWVAYFGSIIIVLLFMELVAVNLLGMQETTFGTAVEIVLDISILGMPLGMAIAILRHRLYDIDRVINRTIVYSVLTILLISLYVALVIVLQTVLRPLTPSSDLAIVASTLAVAAIFNTARRRVQAFVDRRFYRRKYDAQRTLDSFSLRLRDEVDMTILLGDVQRVLDETLQPAHLGLWLRPSRTKR